MDVDQTLRAIKVAEQFVETLAGGISNVAKLGSFATGVGKGIWNLGKKALGAVASAIKSNNPLVKKVSESTLNSAATVKMSLKDLKDIAESRKLNDPQYQKIAKFTDSLEQMGVSVDGNTEIEGYQFTKTSDQRGANIYQVTDAKTGETVTKFSQDQHGKIAIGKHLTSQGKVLKTIDKVGSQLDFDLTIIDLNTIAFNDINKHIDDLDRQLDNTDQSIDHMMIEAETDFNAAVKTSTQMKDVSHQLYGMEDLANRLNQSIQAKQIALSQELQGNPEQQGIESLEVEMMAKKVGAIIEQVKITRHKLSQKSDKFARNHQLNIPRAIDLEELEHSSDFTTRNSGGLAIELMETEFESAAQELFGSETGAIGLNSGNISLSTPPAPSNSSVVEIMSGVTAQVTPGGAIEGSNLATSATEEAGMAISQ